MVILHLRCVCVCVWGGGRAVWAGRPDSGGTATSVEVQRPGVLNVCAEYHRVASSPQRRYVVDQGCDNLHDDLETVNKM